jgi:hypothetical protein
MAAFVKLARLFFIKIFFFKLAAHQTRRGEKALQFSFLPAIHHDSRPHMNGA